MEAYERFSSRYRLGGILTSTPLRELHLPADLCEIAEARFGAKFPNIEDLLTFVLKELVRHDSRKLDQNDQEMIEARLRDLGYL